MSTYYEFYAAVEKDGKIQANTKSAKTVLKNKDVYHAEKCIKLSKNNIGIAGNFITIPYYLAFMIE